MYDQIEPLLKKIDEVKSICNDIKVIFIGNLAVSIADDLLEESSIHSIISERIVQKIVNIDHPTKGTIMIFFQI